MEHGTIVKWHKKEGDEVEEGDLICEIETDKSVMAFEASEEGVLAKILAPDGTKGIKLGKPICVFVDKKEDCSAFANFKVDGVQYETIGTASAVPKANTMTATTGNCRSSIISPSRAMKSEGNRIVAMPYARKLTTAPGINLLEIDDINLNGRHNTAEVSKTATDNIAMNEKSIVSGKKQKEDGKQVLSDNSKYKDIPLTTMRETIAKRLSFSKQNIPHYYLTSEIKMDELLKMRVNLNADLKDQSVKISINDFVIKASALACMDVPEVNSFFLEKEKVIRQNLTVDISVAVKTETGLITPIVHSAHIKSLAEISTEIKQLANKAHNNKLKPNEYMGGTFTVSNLGMFGSIHHFTAIINPPQSCILAVAGSERKVVPDDNENGFKIITTMLVTMSCDHRVVDGAVGAIWLKHFKEYMEKPEIMLM
ncbi:pyruvate dehydrogenase complex dihydrolipoamide acetyltransferase [Brugia pahangi]